MPHPAHLVVPAPLRDGARVRVVRVAGPAVEAQLERGVARLRDHGLDVVVDPPSIGSAHYLAGADGFRRAQLVDGLADPRASALWCARGGYGTTRLLEQLPADGLRRNPRWLVGYSDVTALHLWAWRQGVASVHGPMVAGFHRYDDAGDTSVDDTLALLRSPAAPTFSGLRAHTAGVARGTLVGGNLSLLAALIGSRWLPSLDGLVLFFEEIGEPPYRLDRMLTTLLANERARGLAGVVVGQLTGCTDAVCDDDAVLERVVSIIAERFDGPILSGLPVGHGTSHRPLLHGVPVELDADAGTLGTAADARTKALHTRLLRRPSDDPASLLARALDDGLGSAAQLEAWCDGELVTRVALGRTALTADAVDVPVSSRTLFDVASLTKALATAVLAMRAVEGGRVALDDRAPADLCTSRPTLRDLLRHTSGLPGHVAVFEKARQTDAPAEHARDAFAGITTGAPSFAYSDVGYIALGRWIERLLGAPLDALFAQYVAGPLGLRHTRFGDGSTALTHPAGIVATEWCPWREQTLQGVVHDENAQVLGGVCGHAGLFANASDVATIARALLGEGPTLLAPETIAQMWDPRQRAHGGTYTLGWDTPSGPNSNAGSLLSRDDTVGHLGFTGTSVWIDRRARAVIVLLTNRVHPSRDEARIRTLRPAIHDAVARRMEPWR